MPIQDVQHDSVAALLRTRSGFYVFQEREDLQSVSCPGMWGLFGGSVEAGESSCAALMRELYEELRFAPALTRELATLQVYVSNQALQSFRRQVYHVPLPDDFSARFVLGEGRSFAAYSVDEVFCLGRKAITMDVWAVLMLEQALLSGHDHSKIDVTCATSSS